MNTNPNIAWADEEIAKHRQAIADLETYKRVEAAKPQPPPGPEVFSIGKVPPPPPPSALPLNSIDTTRKGHKKRAILTALANSPGGLRTPEIVSSLIYGGLPDTTVANTSPQLSAYGTIVENLVRHDGGVWKITENGREYLARNE